MAFAERHVEFVHKVVEGVRALLHGCEVGHRQRIVVLLREYMVWQVS